MQCIRISSFCNSTDDCKNPGLVCVDNTCRPGCATDSECGPDHICRDGLCIPAEAAGCDPSLCGSPPQCQTVEGASCKEGQCVYLPEPPGTACDDSNACTENDLCDGNGTCASVALRCDQPPPGECRDGDSSYRTFLAPGACDRQSGSCQYDHVDITCVDCSVNCLSLCDGIACNQTNGGCLLDNHCDPFLKPPGCTSTPAADRTACYLAGETDAQRGLCASGKCVECLTESDCTSPPALAICFDAACDTDGTCSYQLDSSRVCEAQKCENDQLSNERVCGPAGDCPAAGGSTCGGYQCAPDGLSCLQTCSNDGDCAGGWRCAGNVCSPGSELGQCCLSPTSCPTKACEATYNCGEDQDPPVYVCCALGSICCEDDNDCVKEKPGYRCDPLTFSCFGSCPGEDDSPCTDGYHCDASVCVADVGVGSSCDEASDCQSGLHCKNGVCCDETKTCCAAHSDCGTCEKCGGASTCVLQEATEDLKSECTSTSTNCVTDTCSGTASSCGTKPLDTDCGTCRRCDAAGVCVDNSTDHQDCGSCQKCVSGLCANQTASEDLKNECNPDVDCGSGTCDGAGACDYAASGTSCGGGCGTCDGAGTCTGSCTCMTGDSPIIDSPCGSGIDVELPSGCQYERVHERQSGGSRIQDWQTYECQDGTWINVDDDADIFTCVGCTPPELYRWWDNCGDTSHTEIPCP